MQAVNRILPEPENITMDVRMLPKDFPSTPPSPKMIESIREFGVLEPIVMRREGTKLKLINGRRRILAARAAEVKRVPVRIFSKNWEDDRIMALLLNEQRANNPVAELNAVEELLDQGYEESDICLETGLKHNRIKSLLRLRNLIPPIREAFESGRIKFTVADNVSKLPNLQQRKLLRTLEEGDKLTMRNVSDVKRVRRYEAVSRLPIGLFENKIDWKSVAKTRLAELRKDVGPHAPPAFLAVIDKAIATANG